jgi:hypothetical protein
MKDYIETIRYFFFGKAIQKALERTEWAARDVTERYFRDGGGFEEIVKKYKSTPEFAKDSRVKLAELTYTLDPMQVISIRGDHEGNPILITIGKEKLTANEVRNLKEEVKFYKQTRLFKILQETPKSQAHEMMFKKAGLSGDASEDMKGGKYMLLNLDVQERIMSGIEALDTKKMK